MITVATYSKLADAEIVKGRLESEGIAATVLDEATYAAGYGPVLGVRVQVEDADYWGYSYLTYIYVCQGNLSNAAKAAQQTYDLLPTEDHRQEVLAIQQLEEQGKAAPQR